MTKKVSSGGSTPRRTTPRTTTPRTTTRTPSRSSSSQRSSTSRRSTSTNTNRTSTPKKPTMTPARRDGFRATESQKQAKARESVAMPKAREQKGLVRQIDTQKAPKTTTPSATPAIPASPGMPRTDAVKTPSVSETTQHSVPRERVRTDASTTPGAAQSKANQPTTLTDTKASVNAKAASGTPGEPGAPKEPSSPGSPTEATPAKPGETQPNAPTLSAPASELMNQMRSATGAEAQEMAQKAAELAKTDPSARAALQQIATDTNATDASRAAAINAMGTPQSPEDYQSLLEAYGGDSVRVSQAARDGMRENADAVNDYIYKNFDSLSDTAKIGALQQLRGSQDGRAVQTFLDAAGDRDPTVRDRALSNISRAVDRNNELLQNNPQLRERVFNTLGKGLNDPNQEVRYEAQRAMREAQRSYPEQATQAYVDALGQATPETAQDMVNSISTFDDAINRDPTLRKTTADHLKKIIDHPKGGDSWKTQQTNERAFWAMRQIKDEPSLTPFVMDKLNSDDPNMREAALELAPHLSDPTVVKKSIEMLNDPDPGVRKEAQRELSGIGQRLTGMPDADRYETLKMLRDQSSQFPEGSPARQEAAELIDTFQRNLGYSAGQADTALQALKSGDMGQVGEQLSRMDAAGLEMMQRELASQGKQLPEVLQQLQESHPTQAAAIRKNMLEQIARGRGDQQGLVNSLSQSLKDLPAAQQQAFIEDAMKRANQPGNHGFLRNEDLGRAAIDTAAKLGTDDALRGLMGSFGGRNPQLNEQLTKAIQSFPPEQLQRTLMPALNDKEMPLQQRAHIAGALNQVPDSPELQRAAQGFARDNISTLSQEMDTRANNLKSSIAQQGKHLNELRQLHALDLRDNILRPEERARLRRNLRAQEGLLQNLNQHLENGAKEVTGFLGDPNIAGILDKMPAAERDALIGDAIKGLGQTVEGRKFFDEQILPALQGEPGKTPLWENLYKGTQQTTGLGMSVINEFAPALALKGERVYAKALQTALGFENADQVRRLENALTSYQMGNKTAAMETLEQMGLGKLGTSGMRNLTGAFQTMNFALGMRDLVKDPSWKNALSTAKDTAELAETLSTLAREGSHLSRFGKLMGKVAPPLDIVLGAMGARESAQKGDTGGAIFNTLTAVGGATATAGLILDGTVVGAVAGVPLTVIGGVMAGVGSLGSWIFSDTEAETMAKRLGYRPRGIFN